MQFIPLLQLFALAIYTNGDVSQFFGVVVISNYMPMHKCLQILHGN